MVNGGGGLLVLATMEELELARTSTPKGRAAFPTARVIYRGWRSGILLARAGGPSMLPPPRTGGSAAGDTIHQLEGKEEPSASTSVGTSGAARGAQGPSLPREQTRSGFPFASGGLPPRRAASGAGGRGVRARTPVSMAMGGCPPAVPPHPRRSSLSAAAGEQPQPARRHRAPRYRHRGSAPGWWGTGGGTGGTQLPPPPPAAAPPSSCPHVGDAAPGAGWGWQR